MKKLKHFLKSFPFASIKLLEKILIISSLAVIGVGFINTILAVAISIFIIDFLFLILAIVDFRMKLKLSKSKEFLNSIDNKYAQIEKAQKLKKQIVKKEATKVKTEDKVSKENDNIKNILG